MELKQFRKTKPFLRKISLCYSLPHRYKRGSALAGVLQLSKVYDAGSDVMLMMNVKILQELCGENTLRNVVIVTEDWQESTHEEYARREAGLMSNLHFRLAIKKGVQYARHDNTTASAQNIVRLILNNHSLSPTRSPDKNPMVCHSIDNFSGGGEAYKLSVGSGCPRNSYHVGFPLGFHLLTSVTYIPRP